MLLIISQPDDSHVHYLRPHLDARRVDYRIIHPDDFSARATMTLDFARDRDPSRVLTFNGRSFNLGDVRTAWFRQYAMPTAHAAITVPDYQRAAAEISTSCMIGLADSLEVRWSPGKPRQAILAQNKPHQLSIANTLGLIVPRTTITNEPAAALRFYEECGGRIITKTAASIFQMHAPDGRRLMPTHPIRRRDMANFRGLGLAPMILQEYVPKRAELRVTIVADQVFAALIDSQASARTQHDWRHYDHDAIAYLPHQLPPQVEEACLRLLAYFGLRYGAIDFVLTPDGEYVFLELNPVGQWAFVQDLAGLPIAQALAEDLDPATVSDAEIESLRTSRFMQPA
jgi:hypothetical protein